MSGFRGRVNFARRTGGGGGAWRGASAPKGTFLNGVWHCDCNLPLPAVHFQVKKDGPNKGRWFRTCQKTQEERCKFYLWDSDAHPRENAALANNSRTELGPAASAAAAAATKTTPTTTTTPRARRVISPPPPYTPEVGSSETNRKRARSALQQEDDDYGLDTVDADFEEQLGHVLADAETPSKRPRTQTAAFATPSRPTRRRLPWQTDDSPVPNALPTPQTEQQPSDPFPTRFAAPGGSLLTPSRYESSASSSTLTPGPSPHQTPTPARFKNVPEGNLVQDVFGVLRDANVQVSEHTSRSLTDVLSRHATVTEGVKKGREVARASIAAKTAKITELTYRLSTLEAELEAEKAKVSHLQWTLEHGINPTRPLSH